METADGTARGAHEKGRRPSGRRPPPPPAGGSEDLAEREEHPAPADALAAIGPAGHGGALVLPDVGVVPGNRRGDAVVDLVRDADGVPEVVRRAEARVVLDPLVAEAAGSGEVVGQGDVDAALDIVAGAGA